MERAPARATVCTGAPSTPSSPSRRHSGAAQATPSSPSRRHSGAAQATPSSPSRKPSGLSQTVSGSETSQQKRGPSEVALSTPSSPSRRPSLQKESKPFRRSMDPRMLGRKLSFVDCSIGQIQSAIAKEDPSCTFNPHFWQILLGEAAPIEAQPIKNRTLTFWITFYNKWQALGNWRPGYAPNTLNGRQLQEIMPMTERKLLGVIRLFDPPGFKRIHYDGLTRWGLNLSTLEKVTIDVGALMTAGVMLSQVISSKHKLVLILGLVDVNDKKGLVEPEFEEFIRNFIVGLGAAFGLLEERHIFPKEDNIELVAKRLYSRISAASACRLRELLATHDPSVTEAIRQGAQSKLGRPHTAPAAGFASSSSRSSKSSAEMVHQMVSMSALCDWCHKNFADPIATPYSLTIERYCPARQGNDMIDEFDDTLAEFSLSHTSPMSEPPSQEFHGRLLHRREVEQAHYIFEYCHQKRSFYFALDKLAIELQIQVAGVSKNIFERALDMASQANTHINFCDFLRFLCPDARPKHLRMFDSWRYECIQMVEEKEKLLKMEELSTWFTEESAKPTLPLSELHALEEEFKRIDRSGNGVIEPEELAIAWGWNAEATKAAIKKHDVLADGCIDKQEFLLMMCPSDYRLPYESASGREALGKLLSGHTSSKRETVQGMQAKFKGDSAVMKAPEGMMPEVDDATWNSWIRIYENFDYNKDGRVSVSELEMAGMFNKDNCCQVLLESIGEEVGATCVSREAFLRAMLAVHGLRRGGPEKESVAGA